MRTWNPFRADVWAASNATPKRRLIWWAVLAVLIGCWFMPDLLGLLVGLAVVITYVALAIHWANADTLNSGGESKDH
ncbi:hypothetical protein [Leifsonia poae]|uniref:hypothetical protein n=1 Tax=Leifsonia poae TaxID=110933 RepID=UPI003D672C6C